MTLGDFLTEEEVNLYNPAYCGFLILSALRSFSELDDRGIHCALPYLIIPMALSSKISSSLPRSTSTPIASWVSDQGGVLSDFPAMVTAYIPVVNAAMLFLLEKQVIKLDLDGNYLIKNDALSKNPSLFNKTESLKQTFQAANLIGRWFAHSSSVETIYAQLGIKP